MRFIMKKKQISRLALFLGMCLIMTGICGCSDESEGPGAESGRRTAGMTIGVDGSSGKMTIKRPQINNPAPMGDRDTWTIFVYICGSDLESGFFSGGMASRDIKEMCRASSSDRVRFVLETGGCEAWENDKIDNDAIGRFVIEKGKLKAAGEKKIASMGKASTLKDFLLWGTDNYPAEKMGLVFWDHGGGSIAGVCFDELSDNDSLSLREIDAAMLSAYESGRLTDKLEFIGFDACLMGTVETANIMASYADYMIASEENEPGSGWDYKALGDYLADHPGANGADLGKEVCSSYLKQCQKSGDGQIATLAVTDLSRIDGLLKEFNRFAREMYNKSEDKDILTSITRKISSVDRFGGNNKAEGYTNMVDLGGLISSCRDWTASADQAGKALDQAVVCKVSGSDHKKASGLSVYYPLSIQSSGELNTFESVCISPYYMSFVGRQGYGSVNGGDTEDYDEEEIFEGGFWNWLDEFLFDEETGDYDYDTQANDGSWDYFDDHDDNAQSQLITFEEEPGIDEEGVFGFVLDDEGWENTCDVCALLYQNLGDGTSIELGETYDVDVDWDTGTVLDRFDGYWLSLPDGQNLATYIVDVTDEYLVYTSPILLNKKETYLRMRQYYDDGRIKVEGAWEGIDTNGASAKDIIKLKKGDTITPTWYCLDEKGEDLGEYEGDPYRIKGKELQIDYDYMDAGDYDYAFCITDIYGDDYITEPTDFNL